AGDCDRVILPTRSAGDNPKTGETLSAPQRRPPRGTMPVKPKLKRGHRTMTHRPTLRALAQGRTVAVVGDVDRCLAAREDTDANAALVEAIVGPGDGPPPHVHSREEEGFYVLEGEITFQVGDERVVAKAGTFANMPVGTPHSFKNESGRPAR